MTLHPAVAAVRGGVRRALATLETASSEPTVLVACSGGADSLALLSAAVFEVHKAGGRVVGATVDHGLQEGSAEHAAHVVGQMAALGADETAAARVSVEGGGLGPEASARRARHAVLEELRTHLGAEVVWLGHTRDDQAETVLLGLARGSGGRSIAGMRRAYDGFARPLLDVTRLETETACRVEGVEWWRDPHNTDPAYLRARVRATVLPVLETELGPGVAATLARTADQLREDMEYLDRVAGDEFVRLRSAVDERAAGAGPAGGPSQAALVLPAESLGELADAVRRRVLHAAILVAGGPHAEVTRTHVLAVDALVTDWRGQRWVDLPGPLRAVRRGSLVSFTRADP